MDPAQRTAAMWTMAVNAVTVEVVEALAAAGVESLVLKGPSTAGWLYDEDDARSYADSDLLVDPAQVPAAHATLERAGFRRDFGPLPHPGMESPPSYPWRRDTFVVDLHETLPGATADRREVWTVLRDDSTELSVDGRVVPVLGEPARLVHLALHAAHHGARVEPPIEDLRRALAQVAPEQWTAAARVADRLGASAAFAAGLDLIPEGRELLGRMGLDAGPSVDRLLAGQGVPVASGIERLWAAPGLGARGAMLRDELFPSRDFMRWWSPASRGSRPRLVAAYARRWLYLIRHAPSAVRAWRRARAAAERTD